MFTVDPVPLFDLHCSRRKSEGRRVIRHFRDWILNAIKTLGFSEGVDFSKSIEPGRYGKSIYRFTEDSGDKLRRFADDPRPFRSRTIASIERTRIAASSGEMTCRNCGKLLPLSEFERDPSKAHRPWVATCRACRWSMKAERRRARTSTLEGGLAPLLRNATTRSRAKGIDLDIDIAFLVGLWHAQAGLCHYTGKPMIHVRASRANCSGLGGLSRCNPDTVSIDRVDSSRGYTRDNVVLCRWIVNAMKQDIPIELWISTMREIIANIG